jgi:hypothetical protein
MWLAALFGAPPTTSEKPMSQLPWNLILAWLLAVFFTVGAVINVLAPGSTAPSIVVGAIQTGSTSSPARWNLRRRLSWS